MVPVYHGTDPRNFASIFQRGLLIPGKDNDLRVVNGSAFGLGIYTAPLNNPSLSLCYARQKQLLVCACLGGGEGSSKNHLRHGGGAIVVFEQERVIPMFMAHDPDTVPDSTPPGKRHPVAALLSGPPEQGGTQRAALRRRRADRRAATAAKGASGLATHCYYARRAARRRRG